MISCMFADPMLDPIFVQWLSLLLPDRGEIAILSPHKEIWQTKLAQLRPGLTLCPARPGLDFLLVEGELECSTHPETDLQSWLQWLQPIGRLVLRVPNLRFLPHLVSFLEGQWPITWTGVERQAFTSEMLLSLLYEYGWETLEMQAQEHVFSQQVAIRRALEPLGWDLTGFDADSHISHFYVLATPQQKQALEPLSIEGLGNYNLLLPLIPESQKSWQALADYLKKVPVNASVSCVVVPQEQNYDPQYWQKKLSDWLEQQGFDANQIPDLILPDVAFASNNGPRLIAAVDILISADIPHDWLEWARRQGKDLLWLEDRVIPQGFLAENIFHNWDSWLPKISPDLG
jgi:hypothetical protein